jgi:HlyD family secretion protein
MIRPSTSAVLAVLLATTGSLAGCGKKEATTANPAATAPTVSVTTVQRRVLGGGVTASGALVSREEAAVGSELSGYRVAYVRADEGDWVRAGQPLAQLDDTLLRAQIDQQAAQTAQAEAQANRVAGLDNEGVLSKEQIETRRFQALAAKAALAEMKTRQSRMTIVAPVSGRVLERTVRPGDVAGGATTWFRIARDGLVELDAQLNETDVAKIRAGQTVQVSLPSGANVNGQVRLVSPRIDPNTKLAGVRVRLPVRDDLRPGGFARATFNPVGASSLSVPESAVRYGSDGAAIVTVDANNRTHIAPVRTGARSGGFVELVQGATAGARVLLGASAFALDGDLVRPVAAATGAR